MNNLNFELKVLQVQSERMQQELNEIHELLGSVVTRRDESKEYYTVEECAITKGGAALNTFKTNRFLLPGCGNPRYAVYIGGRLCFRKEDVIKWLRVTDADYIDYAKECGVTAVPEKYQRLALKAKQKIGE